MLNRMMMAAGAASAFAGLYIFLIRSGFQANSAGVDGALYAIWTAGYFLCAFALSLLLVWPARRWFVAAGGRLRAASLLLLAVAPLSLLLFVSTRARTSSGEPAGESLALLAPTDQRITLLGLDGLDPTLLVQLVEEDVLPNFRRLIEGGSFGELATVSPHSPVVWTSIATGAAPDMHGVSGYTSEYLRGTPWSPPRHGSDWLGRWLLSATGFVEEAAVSASERRQKAIWELLSQIGLHSLVVSWWASYPADSIDGVVISNRAIPWEGFLPEHLAALESIDGLTHPESMQGIARRAAEEAVRQSSSGGVIRTSSRYFEVRDEIAWRIFLQLRSERYAFSTVYLQGVDTGSHAYTHAVFGENRPDARPMRVEEERAHKLFRQLVARAYRRMDARIGVLLERLGADESLVVVSDHGWRYDGSGHWSQPAGVVICFGPAFRENTRLNGSHVYDLLPTIGGLLSLPPSQELPGRPILTALREPESVASLPAIPSYGARGKRPAGRERGSDEGHLERLRALGYID